MPEATKKKNLSPEVKAILSKLPSAEAVHVLDEMLGKVADQNNSSNFAQPVSKEEAVEKLKALPDSKLRDILKEHGIL